MTASLTAITPPAWVVVFTSLLSDDSAGYGETAERIAALARQQPGFLDMKSLRDPATGLGITVSYWRDADAIAAWKAQADHLGAQAMGRSRWYRSYRIEVAEIRRARSGP